MKCPNDQSEMEKGVLASHGKAFVKGIDAKVQKAMSFGVANVDAYRCPKCGKVELTTEVK